MTARTVANVYALGRLGLGCALVATPSFAARPWIGDAADAPGTRAVVVGFGARDVGIALGTLTGVALSRALGDQGITQVSVPVAQLGVYLVVAAAVGIVAAIGPARRASNVDVLRAVVLE